MSLSKPISGNSAANRTRSWTMRSPLIVLVKGLLLVLLFLFLATEFAVSYTFEGRPTVVCWIGIDHCGTEP